MSMTLEEAQSIISGKILSLEWQVSNINLGAYRYFDVSYPPLLRGSVVIYSDGDGHVCLQSDSSVVFESKDSSIISFFKDLLDNHLKNQEKLCNEAVVKTAIALQSL